ncbi:hypothetical protein ACFYW8_04145 [Streptomyces sp. NPDC002742]|uniref:hypothetical protein n=1 Tax=Streptomyces sp. NPDC002742 TaxID=3364663 RepID=UPI003674E403
MCAAPEDAEIGALVDLGLIDEGVRVGAVEAFVACARSLTALTAARSARPGPTVPGGDSVSAPPGGSGTARACR